MVSLETIKLLFLVVCSLPLFVGLFVLLVIVNLIYSLLFSSFFSCLSPCSLYTTFLPRAQHINIGHSHPPRTIILKCPFAISRKNFPEFPGSAFCLVFLYSLIGSPEVPGVCWHLTGEGFWRPRILFSGKMKLICWAAVTHSICLTRLGRYQEFIGCSLGFWPLLGADGIAELLMLFLPLLSSQLGWAHVYIQNI